jgi:hypothetical protein
MGMECGILQNRRGWVVAAGSAGAASGSVDAYLEQASAFFDKDKNVS